VGQQDGITVDNLHELLKGHGAPSWALFLRTQCSHHYSAQRLLQVEEENRVLRTTLHSALEDLNRRIMQARFVFHHAISPSHSQIRERRAL
jgi:hypothetical protein